MGGGETRPVLDRITVDVAARRRAVVGAVAFPSVDGTLTTWEEDDEPLLALALAEDVTPRFAAVRDFAHPGLVPWRALEATEDGWLALAPGLFGTALPDAVRETPDRLHAWVAQLVDLLVALDDEGIAHGGLAEAPWVVDALGTLRIGPVALTRHGTGDDDRRATGMRLASIADGPLARWAIRLGQTGDRDWLEAARAFRGPPPEERYALEPEPIGVGGMGVVYRARDVKLGRTVAVKVLEPGSDRLEGFRREARLTARLQHPGIVPVHDLGDRYYAMEEVRGRRLDEVAAELRAAPGGWTRLAAILARVCETLAFAHAEGVVHRDVKPENVMVGEFGEVRVVDWGIAARTGEAAPRAGTPAYMAPEQWSGAPADPRVDVFALGRTIAELIGEDGPSALRELAARCTVADAGGRPAHAGEVADAVQAWIEQRDRESRAEAVVAEASRWRRRADEALEEARQLRSRAEAALAEVESWDPVDDKREAWAFEDRADQLERDVAEARTRYEQGLRAALDHDPSHREALDALAVLYRDQLVEAESTGRRADAIRLETLLQSHDGGRYRDWLRSDGAVTVLTDPPSATVTLERYVEQDRRLVAVTERTLGATPLVEVELPRGSWCLRLAHPECDEVRYPVFVGREEHWAGVPPGGTEPLPIWLPARGELGEDEVYVPAGWFASGGDPDALDGLPRTQRWVDGFVMERFPVTVSRYLQFLEAMATAGSLDEDWVPRVPQAGPIFRRSSEGWVLTGEGQGPYALEPEWPVTAIPWTAAVAFANWRRSETGAPWRLPHDQEWEKAARGCDGRVFPWGPRWDGTFARAAQSQPGAYAPTAVTDHPVDASPFGIRGLAGNARDWCANGYRRHGDPGPRLEDGPGVENQPLRIARGGCYSAHPQHLRTASRTVYPHDWRNSLFSFRLVRSAPAPG